VDLKGPGLKGQPLKLIIADGNSALLRALREIYPLRRIQRCVSRKLRNGAAKPKGLNTHPAC
jgi:transposase-like protein